MESMDNIIWLEIRSPPLIVKKKAGLQEDPGSN